MRILALEPYHGGSHKAFLDGWSSVSGHQWTILGLPAFKWKWRMHHAALTLAGMTAERAAAGERWDIIFCSDMLNLAEFRGLAPAAVRDLPAVIYFHENQLTYPVRHPDERDYHYAMINFLSACAAGRVWFNSLYHLDAFYEALAPFLRGMADFQPLEEVARVRGRSVARHPGIGQLPRRTGRPAGPLRILWAARWEHDKNPDDFFAALRGARRQGAVFRLDVVGQSFRDRPEVFDAARTEFADCIDRWGYLASRAEYEAALTAADIFVSTADHEFFGLSAVEAAAAGAIPLLPMRLAYPEVFGPGAPGGSPRYFYDGTVSGLAAAIRDYAVLAGANTLADAAPPAADMMRARFGWDRLAPIYDAELAAIAGGRGR